MTERLMPGSETNHHGKAHGTAQSTVLRSPTLHSQCRLMNINSLTFVFTSSKSMFCRVVRFVGSEEKKDNDEVTLRVFVLF